MTQFKVIYELHMSWIGDSFIEVFDYMQEALDRAASVAKRFPGASGMIIIYLWKPEAVSQILGFCSLRELYNWPHDIVKEALL